MKLRAYKHPNEISLIPKFGIVIEKLPQVWYLNFDLTFIVWTAYIEFYFER